MSWKNKSYIAMIINFEDLSIKRSIILIFSVLIVIGFFVYSFNLNNELFWDDNDWILNNVSIHSISWDNSMFWLTNNTLAGVGLRGNYYRPFLFFSFALNYLVSGTISFSYHLLSNSIHVINGLLVFGISYLIFRRKLLAFLVSLIFLIHPLQTEAITYISGRGDALVAMFMLFSFLLFYLSEVQKRSWFEWPKILSLVSLVLGLLSRETGIIFPVLALAFYVSVLSSDRFIKSIKTGILKTWPYFTTVIVYGVLRLTVLNFQNTLNFYTEPNIYSENLYVRFFTFLPILWEYIKLLFVPVGLHMERGAIVYTSLFQWPVWPVFIGLAGLVFWLRYLYIQNTEYRIRNIEFKIWFLGLCWFFISLGPVSGITPINALIYEHWLYFPMIGFWLIISYYLVRLFDYLKFKSLITPYWLLTISLVTYLSFFSYQAIQRNLLWGDEERFFKDILSYEPASSRVNNNLGNIYFNRGDMKNAELFYRKATAVGDAFAEPYYNLGTILQSRGDTHGAVQLYEKAIQINPGFYYAYQNLAVIYAQQGNLPKSVENIEKLKLLIPNNPRVYYNSALVYIALNDKKRALEDVNTGLKHSSSDLELTKLFEELGRELSK